MGWVEEALRRVNRRLILIAFDPHYLAREAERNLDVDLVERTVRMGRPVLSKCTPPDRICFKLYIGKPNETYEVPVQIHNDFWEVKSAWLRRGRR